MTKQDVVEKRVLTRDEIRTRGYEDYNVILNHLNTFWWKDNFSKAYIQPFVRNNGEKILGLIISPAFQDTLALKMELSSIEEGQYILWESGYRPIRKREIYCFFGEGKDEIRSWRKYGLHCLFTLEKDGTAKKFLGSLDIENIYKWCYEHGYTEVHKVLYDVKDKTKTLIEKSVLE